MGSIPITRSICARCGLMVAASPGALHARLKAETAGEHARLEADVERKGFFTSLPRYTEYLRRFGAFQSEIEQTLDAQGAGAVIADWAQRRRAHLASVDLRVLVAHQDLPQAGAFQGVSATSQSFRGSPAPERILGIAYVIEGATLGGAFLLKGLAELGVTATHGGAFLASYGNARGRMWQRFLATLRDWEQRGVAHEPVVAAAFDTFRCARTHLIDGAQRDGARSPG